METDDSGWGDSSSGSGPSFVSEQSAWPTNTPTITPAWQVHLDNYLNQGLAEQNMEAEEDQQEDEEDDHNPHKYEECLDRSRYFAAQMSPEEYRKETEAFTKESVDFLLQSPEYQRMNTRCRLCWHVWSEGMANDTCLECGGYAMERPCPICNGKCGRVWIRDVDMSHSHNEAHWDGECGLPQDEQQMYKSHVLTEEGTEENVLDAMEQLSTS